MSAAANIAEVAAATASAAQYSPVNTGLLTIAIGILGLLLRHQLQNRKLKIEEDSADRKGWGELIQTLTDQVKRLTEQVSQLQTENGQLREEIRSLHGTIDGMRRENLQVGNSAARAVMEAMPTDVVPPSTRASLERRKGTGQ